jgi:PAS domain S-box-containing protein
LLPYRQLQDIANKHIIKRERNVAGSYGLLRDPGVVSFKQGKACKPPVYEDAKPAFDLSPARFEAVLRSISDGVFTIDLNGIITCFNRAAEEITGVTREEAIGKPCHTIFRTELCKDACALRYTMEHDTPIVDLMVYIKNATGEEIPVSISTALFRNESGEVVGGVETFRDLRQVEVLRKKVQESYTFRDIVSKSAAMREVLEKLPAIAAADSTVLLTGESGTGKELVARAIHDLSERAQGPFVPVNSAGIPDTLMEAELFGYEAGAFTGAVKTKPGRFARAENGTLFLDEIGELPMLLQAKLLRVIQERTYEPLGGVQLVRANVRIVAATNQDLDQMVAKRAFRGDLYYRINVVRIELPPLRERTGDIPLLTDYFIRSMSAERSKRIGGISPKALSILMQHDWPGNVRELQNAIEHGFVLAPGPWIDVEHLPASLTPASVARSDDVTLEDAERSFIISALERNHHNREATARQLGIHKTTFFRKVRKLGIQLPQTDGRSSKQ